MNLQAALRYLDQHTNLEATAGPVPRASRSNACGRWSQCSATRSTPYPVIHITGTNGKGSVARMVTELLRPSGLSVGTYTSPHLEPSTSAWRGTARPSPMTTLAEAIGTIAAIEPLAGIAPSYFEILTAAAFGWFAERRGRRRGGRGRPARPLRRHQRGRRRGGRAHQRRPRPHRRRGAWRAAIAEEKVGIVKPGPTFVVGETDPDLRRCSPTPRPRRRGCAASHFDVDQSMLALGGRTVDLRTPAGLVEDLSCRCTASTRRQRIDRPGGRRGVLRSAARRRPGPRSVRRGHGPRPVRDRPPRAPGDPRRRAQPRRRPGGAAHAAPRSSPSTARWCWWSACSRAATRPRCSTRSAPPTPGSVIACTPDSPSRHSGRRGGRRRRPARVSWPSPVASVAGAVQRARALASPDDLVLVTGSLYVVGPARTSCGTEVDA